MPLLNTIVLLPYLLYTWILWHAWRLSDREPACHELCDGITIGRRLLPAELPAHVTAVYDLTSEFPEPRGIRSRVAYRCMPTLDSRAPRAEALLAAAREISAGGKSVFIHCANGHGRTGTLAAAVLMVSRGMTLDEAIAFIRSKRPRVAVKPAQFEALRRLAALLARPVKS